MRGHSGHTKKNVIDKFEEVYEGHTISMITYASDSRKLHTVEITIPNPLAGETKRKGTNLFYLLQSFRGVNTDTAIRQHIAFNKRHCRHLVDYGLELQGRKAVPVPAEKPKALAEFPHDLEEIDLSRGDKSDHPDIEAGAEYLAEFYTKPDASGPFSGKSKYPTRYVIGSFTRQHYGWNFQWCWGTTTLQFNTPGYNHSDWSRLWKIIRKSRDESE